MNDDVISSTANQLAAIFERTWNDRDGSGYGTAYWPEAELVDPMGQIWDGRQAIVQMHVDLWEGPFSKTHVRARVRRVRNIGATAAVVDLEIRGKDFPIGDGVITARLKHVIEKRGAEWKITASQNTFVAGPPADR